MVLSPPPVDAVAAAPPPAWVARLSLLLELAAASVIILVEAPDHASIGTFIRAVGDTHGHVHVITDVTELLTLPEGALVVLCPSATDAEWLNMKRPWVVDRSLRILIWADNALAGCLHEQAPDFFDWISHYQACPPTPVEFARRGLRLARQAPGICWFGEPDRFSVLLAEVDPAAQVVRLDATTNYENMIAMIKAAGDAWLLWTAVDGQFRVRRIRWALAECRRSGRVVLTGANPVSPGWFPLHAFRMSLHEMTAALRLLGLEQPARAAVLCELEPDIVQIAQGLRDAGLSIAELEACFAAPDPAAALGGKTLVKRGVLLPVQGTVPLFRVAAASAGPAGSGRHQERELRRHLRRNEPVDAQTLATVAATARWDGPLPAARQTPLCSGWQVEALLRGRSRSPEEWLTFVRVAGALGDHDVQLAWVQRGLHDPKYIHTASEYPFFEQMLTAIEGIDTRMVNDAILADAERLLNPHAPEVDTSMLLDFAAILAGRGRLRDAEKLLRRALELQPPGQRDEEGALLRRQALEQLFDVLTEQGRALETELHEELSRMVDDEAQAEPPEQAASDAPLDEVGLRARIDRRAAELGEEHPTVIRLLLALGESLQASGRRAERLVVLLDAGQRLGTGMSQDAGLQVDVVGALLESFVEDQRYAEADQLFGDFSARFRERVGQEHPAHLALMEDYAQLLVKRGESARAEHILRELLRIVRDSHGPSSGPCRDAVLQLAELMVQERRWREAATLLDETRAELKRAGVQDGAYSVEATLLYVRILRGESRFKEAEQALRRSLRRVRLWPRQEWRDEYLELVEALGDLLMGLARYAQAAKLYRSAIADEPSFAEALTPLAQRAEGLAVERPSSSPG